MPLRPFMGPTALSLVAIDINNEKKASSRSWRGAHEVHTFDVRIPIRTAPMTRGQWVTN